MKDGGAHIYSPEELRGLQLVLLEMLVEVDRVCKKNGISYCLAMGTMLGAIRHRGFIPWDDDLDVAMLRPEYEKFRLACERDLDRSKFFFQDHLTDSHYRWGYARIRRLDSEFVRVGQEHLKMRTGIFLDIFPHDSMPGGTVARALHSAYCYTLRKLLYAETGRRSAAGAALRVWYAALALVPRRWVFARLERLATDRALAKRVRILTFPLPKGGSRGYLRRWFEQLENIEFEGRTFPGVRDFEAYLTYNYGDFRSLPPAEERRCCHPAAKFQLPSAGP